MEGDALLHYEAEARKRMLAGKKVDPTEKIREGSKGEAANHAARDFKVTSSSPSSPGLRELP